ncbi:stabilizer of iron transporter SufD /Polynucleotidyl transferase [Striga asiatica]|uniref:Stabilizer of iron transporter SufD /Polynucleotidyl transferase n=1 Tax=Striga asiatica TaxID=4170 RepID=A0A5A7PM39_STRAF|nr:stabilizer of iron transporter SufD /Polynucleotidyl transferase [Striga asiatica]
MRAVFKFLCLLIIICLLLTSVVARSGGGSRGGSRGGRTTGGGRGTNFVRPLPNGSGRSINNGRSTSSSPTTSMRWFYFYTVIVTIDRFSDIPISEKSSLTVGVDLPNGFFMGGRPFLISIFFVDAIRSLCILTPPWC